MGGRIKAALACVAVLALVALALPGSAGAAGAGACVETNTYTFSPPLEISPEGGSVGFSFSNDLCADVIVNEGGNLVAVPVPGSRGSGGFSGTYFGNCTLVFVNGPGVGLFELRLIIGGAVQLTVTSQNGTDAHTKAGLLVPDNPCPIETTTGGAQISTHAHL